MPSLLLGIIIFVFWSACLTVPDLIPAGRGINLNVAGIQLRTAFHYPSPRIPCLSHRHNTTEKNNRFKGHKIAIMTAIVSGGRYSTTTVPLV